MKQKWGRPDDAGDFPSDKAAWTIGACCVALLSVFAIAGYRYMRVWTPLQRHYITVQRLARLLLHPAVTPNLKASGFKF